MKTEYEYRTIERMNTTGTAILVLSIIFGILLIIIGVATNILSAVIGFLFIFEGIVVYALFTLLALMGETLIQIRDKDQKEESPIKQSLNEDIKTQKFVEAFNKIQESDKVKEFTPIKKD